MKCMQRTKRERERKVEKGEETSTSRERTAVEEFFRKNGQDANISLIQHIYDENLNVIVNAGADDIPDLKELWDACEKTHQSDTPGAEEAFNTVLSCYFTHNMPPKDIGGVTGEEEAFMEEDKTRDALLASGLALRELGLPRDLVEKILKK